MPCRRNRAEECAEGIRIPHGVGKNGVVVVSDRNTPAFHFHVTASDPRCPPSTVVATPA